MHCRITPTRLGAALLTLTLTLVACGGGESTTPATPFCAAIGEVAARMEPNSGSMTPQAVEARFDEVVTLLDEAEQTAPSVITDDVATYAAAIDDYATALAAVGFDLDALFSTPPGAQLAEDTSHALTPDVINHMTGPCGITLR